MRNKRTNEDFDWYYKQQTEKKNLNFIHHSYDVRKKNERFRILMNR